MSDKYAYDKLEARMSELRRELSLSDKDKESRLEKLPRYKDLFDRSPIGIFRTTSSGQSVYTNPAMDRILGIGSPEEAERHYSDIGRQFYVDSGRREEFLHLLRQNGHVENFEYEGRTIDGRTVWISMNAHISERGQDGTFIIDGFATDITQRKQNEEALKRSESFLRSLLRTIPDLVWLKDPQGVYLACNSRFESFFGAKEREIIGKTDYDFVGEYLADFFRSHDKAAMAVGGPQRIEEEIVFAEDGHHEILETIKTPMYDNDGELIGVLGIGRDITSRKSIEEKLKESEERLRLTLEATQVGIWDWDVKEDQWSVSPTYYTMLGYEPASEKANRSEWLSRIHPQDRPEVDRKLQNVLKDNSAEYRYDARIRHANGQYRWCHARGFSKQRDEAGNVARMVGIRIDIHERREAEESLRKLSQAVEQSPVSIVIIDAAGNIEFVNSQFTRSTGYTASEVIGLNPRIMQADGTPSDEYERLWQTISAGGVWQGAFHSRKKNGDLFWEKATIAPIRNAESSITHYVAIKEDVTEHRKLEEQLRQAQKMEAIGQLAGGIAHDFNNMLGAIIGYCELSMMQIDPSHPLFAFLNEIHKAADRSADLTRQLLAFARKQTIDPKVLNLNQVIERSLNMLKRVIGENIELSWLPGQTRGRVHMDPTQIDQILTNLCVNARDAIEGVGKITIETHDAAIDEEYCSTHLDFSPGDFVLLAVSDNGCGMDRETLAKIFEPFFTTKEKGKGTGLGLATIYGIVKQNNGFINVYSEPMHGSTFKIYLPRYFTRDEMAGKDVRGYPPAKGEETILLVEDEAILLDLNKLLLEKLGYRVLTASSPGEAIKIAAELNGKIHLLITDVVMPEMNGKDLSETILSIFPGIRCLFVSGYMSNVIAHHGILDKGMHFLQKPFSIQSLAAKVREVLDNG